MNHQAAKKFYDDHSAQLQRIAADLGVPVGWLVTIIGFETGQSFSPSKTNSLSGNYKCVGLIQFCGNAAKDLGYTIAQIAAMSTTEQLELVRSYFFIRRANKPPYSNLADLYLAVLYPALRGKGENAVFASEASSPTRYKNNKGLDSNEDGVIYYYEINDFIMRYYNGFRAYNFDNVQPQTAPNEEVLPEPATDAPLIVLTPTEEEYQQAGLPLPKFDVSPITYYLRRFWYIGVFILFLMSALYFNNKKTPAIQLA